MALPDRFRMKITYPDGSVHEGKKDFTCWTDYLGITDLDFKGKKVLDIATDEGWWAFWAEMQGATYVEASDVEKFEDYDWGEKIDYDFCNTYNAVRGGRSVLDFHHSNLNSKVVVKKESIYQLSGTFDIIFCHGLLYHLRHPLQAIETTRKSCNGLAIFETFIDTTADQLVAQTKFYRTTELGSITNWTGATSACFASWMKDAGYDHIFMTRENYPGPTRKIFICLIGETEFDRFKNNKNLFYCDNEYWKQVHESTKFNNKT